MINSNVSNVNIYVGSDGKIHFKNSAGADTALNFSSGGFKPYTLPNMTLGAYYVEENQTNIATSNIFIATVGASSITLTMNKNHYCSWYIKDPSNTNIRYTTARGATTNTYTLDVSAYDYIRIHTAPNGSGYANCSIQNISLS